MIVITNETKLNGNGIDMILFDPIKAKTDFYLMIPEKNKEDFKYLVLGDNYFIEMQLLKENNLVSCFFNANLTSFHNGTDYGNRIYNI